MGKAWRFWQIVLFIFVFLLPFAMYFLPSVEVAVVVDTKRWGTLADSNVELYWVEKLADLAAKLAHRKGYELVFVDSPWYEEGKAAAGHLLKVLVVCPADPVDSELLEPARLYRELSATFEAAIVDIGSPDVTPQWVAAYFGMLRAKLVGFQMFPMVVEMPYQMRRILVLIVKESLPAKIEKVSSLVPDFKFMLIKNAEARRLLKLASTFNFTSWREFKKFYWKEIEEARDYYGLLRVQ